MKRSHRNTAAAIVAIFALLVATAAFADGAAVYKAKCAMCHGATGAGDTPVGKTMKVPPLASPDVQKKTDAELTTVVTDGKGKMPANKGKLSPDDIKAVVAFVRTLKK
jgi:mono/diheme cytochrome c family protein